MKALEPQQLLGYVLLDTTALLQVLLKEIHLDTCVPEDHIAQLELRHQHHV